MSRPIGELDTFELTRGQRLDRYRRERDTPRGTMRVTHLTSTMDARMRPYTFDAEPAWFVERGLRTK